MHAIDAKKSFYLIDAKKYQTVLEPSFSLSNLLHRYRAFLKSLLGLIVSLKPRQSCSRKEK